MALLWFSETTRAWKPGWVRISIQMCLSRNVGALPPA